jgi:ATP-dependent Clp protease ATP-binding subunit ClpA
MIASEMERQAGLTEAVLLNPEQKGLRAEEFEQQLSQRIVGQERAVRRMSGLYQIFLAGMNPLNRPIGTMLFLGPTGSGKTRSGGRSPLWRSKCDRQNRLRRISAFA